MKQKPIKPPQYRGEEGDYECRKNSEQGPGNRREEAGEFHDHGQEDRDRDRPVPGCLRVVFLRQRRRRTGRPQGRSQTRGEFPEGPGD